MSRFSFDDAAQEAGMLDDESRSGADSCPTCGSDDWYFDRLSSGRSVVHDAQALPCSDPFRAASPPTKPRYWVGSDGGACRIRCERGTIAECRDPTDAALIVKLLNENEGKA